jgi:hypothetical protein
MKNKSMLVLMGAIFLMVSSGSSMSDDFCVPLRAAIDASPSRFVEIRKVEIAGGFGWTTDVKLPGADDCYVQRATEITEMNMYCSMEKDLSFDWIIGRVGACLPSWTVKKWKTTSDLNIGIVINLQNKTQVSVWESSGGTVKVSVDESNQKQH